MRAAVLALACLACVGHARRVAFNPSSLGMHSNAVTNEPVARQAPTMTAAEQGVSRRKALGAAVLAGAALAAPREAKAVAPLPDARKLQIQDGLTNKLKKLRKSVNEQGKEAAGSVESAYKKVIVPLQDMMAKQALLNGEKTEITVEISKKMLGHMDSLQAALKAGDWTPVSKDGKSFPGGQVEVELDTLVGDADGWWKQFYKIEMFSNRPAGYIDQSQKYGSVL